VFIVVMGVSGAGKSTLGIRLAEELGWDFVEGDDYHPNSNVERMRAGNALTDADRRPWLDRLNHELRRRASHNRSAVVACSALKPAHRDLLGRGIDDIQYVYLFGSPASIRQRLETRVGHFMPPGLLNSQLALLNPPSDAVPVPVDLSTEEQLRLVLQAIDTQEPS
jgi:gluconokinase